MKAARKLFWNIGLGDEGLGTSHNKVAMGAGPRLSPLSYISLPEIMPYR